MGGTGRKKIGYDKIWFCAQRAERDGLQYFWVGTCCITRQTTLSFRMLSTLCFAGTRMRRSATSFYQTSRQLNGKQAVGSLRRRAAAMQRTLLSARNYYAVEPNQPIDSQSGLPPHRSHRVYGCNYQRFCTALSRREEEIWDRSTAASNVL